MVFQEADLSIRVVRDVLVEEFEGAIIDDPKQYERVTKFLQRTAPELADSVELYKEQEPLLEKWGVEEAFDSVLSRRVDLPSGGYLIIDYAEALTVIDINTGSFTGRGKGRLEDTITKVNVEAAEEVVRQLRMRDIGGIIVIDFIDMARSRNRDQVLKTLREALDEDRTKTYVVEVSPLGLVEMTRQNVTDGVREILTKRCPTCDGEGVVASEETVAITIVRKLQEVVDGAAEARGLPGPGEPAGRGGAAAARLRPAPSSRRRPASGSTSRAARPCRSTPSRWSRPATTRGDRGAGAALPGRRRGAGDDRGAAHVQRRRRGRPGRLLHRQRHRRRPPRRRAADGPDRERRALRGDAPPCSTTATAALEDGDGGEKLESAASGGRRRRGSRGGRRRSSAARRRRQQDRAEHRHVRSRRDRRQAVPGREGLDPARRPPARQGGRQGRPAPGRLPRQGDGGRQGRSRRSRSRPRSPGTSAARRSGSSSTRRRRATGASAGHRSELTRLEVTDIKMLSRQARGPHKPAAKKPTPRREEGGGSRWLIRRDSDPAATAATRTRRCSASRSSPARRSTAARSSSASAAPASAPATASASAATTRSSPPAPAWSSSSPAAAAARSRSSTDE